MKLVRKLFILAACLCFFADIPAHSESVKNTGSISSRVKLSKSKQPNVIIFFCDNLGYGDIEPFGSRVNRTPNLNRMVKEGRKFTGFYVTAGVCTPSRASIMTGCYSQRVGMHLNPRDGNVIRPISPYGLNPRGKTPNDRIIDGFNNRSLIIGKRGAKSPYKVFYYYNADQLQAVKSGPWKLFLPLRNFVQHPHFKKGEGEKPLLFNVENDISSAYNLAEKYPEIVSRLMVLAEKGREDLGDTNRPGANQRLPGKIDNPVPVTLE